MRDIDGHKNIKNYKKKGAIFIPLTSMSDQDQISPYNINALSTKWVTRIKKNINLRIISWSNTKFSEQKL